jgi:hypothetical protein
MNTTRIVAMLASLLFLPLCGCNRSGTSDSGPVEVEINGTTGRITGPLAHENMAVLFLHSDDQDERDFLTLDEGLKIGSVKITEQEQETVGSLLIDNQSDRPLYLQEGERLQGGKQDRTLISSLVIPAHSGKMSVRTMCVEQSRWIEGEKGRAFGFTVNAALAPKGVRGAAKVEGDQGRVWDCVAAQKVTAGDQFAMKIRNSSVNEMLDAPQVQKISDSFADALCGAIDDERDVVGAAVVVNGQIEEVNVYPNHALFCKLFPRLVRSYAVQATMLKDQTGDVGSVLPSAVAEFLKEDGEKSKREKTLDAHNTVEVRELADNRFQCRTQYDGSLVHWQVMKKNGTGTGTAVVARCGLLGNDW